MLSRLTGRELDGLRLYEEVVKPAGLVHSAIATVPVPRGEAFLGVSDSRADGGPLSEQEMLSLMRMVFPSFEAGVEMLLRLEGYRTTLAESVDELGQPIAILGAHDRELHRSERLREILSADSEGETVVRRMRGLARSVLRFRGAKHSEGRGSPGAEEVETETARYALRATLIGRGLLGLERAVVVLVERLTPQLPAKRSLIERYELTPRQAEVALLLAQGLSDHEIGERLGISHHTARHHAEWVFTKLGIHSRKAVGLKLLGYDL